MRAAAFLAGAIMAIGLFLVVASVAALPPTWIGLGTLAISLTAALGVVMSEGRSTVAR